MRNQCGIVRDLLPSYIDGLCSNESKEFIEIHNKSCDACREVLNQMKTEVSFPNEKDRVERLTAKKPFKKLKNILIISISSLLILAVILTAIVFEYLNQPRPVDTNSIIIQEIVIENNQLTVIGDTAHSALWYSGEYEINYDGVETLYLIPRYRQVSKENSSGRFVINHEFRGELLELDLASINKIYLQGKNPSDIRLIWER
ncbi:zf-HC2 domain-containing protein [Anaerobacillus sp. CMMVII]|uniref:zf-HC2 domain-containing protein n=1 Tax=Anaerobacillus sp. CMMVII TaxID=2755588 RepID=UPI0021B7E15F|nr:zf-HC2 domain-containing protein [Anaerobacillus sp. CMMVII]MCT8136750.1 zf-HC2 domain-containing protein [Anaerobacillus sp. CMMVII]